MTPTKSSTGKQKKKKEVKEEKCGPLVIKLLPPKGETSKFLVSFKLLVFFT